MHKLAISTGIILSLASMNFAQADATGTVNFQGKLYETTCDVSVEEQGADAIVTLPTVGIEQLSSAGMIAGRTEFNMKLSDCPWVTARGPVTAFFEAGPTVDLVTGRLKNASGTAGNVDLIIYYGGGTVQSKAGTQPKMHYTFSGNPTTVTLPYAVAYYAKAPTTAGTVRSSVVYSISYR
ncbi:fimbrial protein [Serratia aquatilis]|uniref:Fimbrial protein n=1 Tax=Serratia aquatilis TaxID=1737515 RepID=A0ABV6EAV5_9GAMM